MNESRTLELAINRANAYNQINHALSKAAVENFPRTSDDIALKFEMLTRLSFHLRKLVCSDGDWSKWHQFFNDIRSIEEVLEPLQIGEQLENE